MKMIYPHEIGYAMIFAMVESPCILSDADTIKGVPEDTPVGFICVMLILLGTCIPLY